MPAPGDPGLCVVLHDVAPARWAGCQRVLLQLRAVAAEAGVPLPLSLLVVPRLHGQAAAPPAWQRWMQRMQDDGHEWLLHGWTHRDDAPPAGGPPWRRLADHAWRRWYTAGEAEFAALPEAEAARRLCAGLDWVRQQGLAVQGVVPPAWRMGDGGWRALRRLAADPPPGTARLRYACTWGALVRLADGARVPAPALVFSTRAAWRRQASRAWNTAVFHHHRTAPLLRLELHPQDADHAEVCRCWSALLRQALQQRHALTLGDAARAAWAGLDGLPPDVPARAAGPG